MDLGKKVRKRREEMGWSQDELARKMGYSSRTSINKIENGRPVSQKIIVRLAEALDVSVAYLMDWEEESAQDNIFPIMKKAFPVLGEIACGEPIFTDEEHESFIVASADIDADFCLRAKGDSMINARIHDGDFVFVKKQPIVENGQIAVVIIGDEATLKRFYYYKEQNLVILRPENPSYQDMTFSGEDLNQIRIIGKAVLFQGLVK